MFIERTESNIHGEMLSVTMNNGIIRASDNGRFDNSNNDKSKYKVVKVGDIAYNSMRMWQGASGCSDYEGIVSPAYTVVVPQGDVNSTFFAYLFKTDRMIDTFRLNSQGLTSDTWNLKYPAFSKIPTSYPVKFPEQQKIASYFTSLDQQIKAATKRVASLKQVKAACLQSMFPQEGETVPKVRFQGFEGEWKERKFDNVIGLINDRGHNVPKCDYQEVGLVPIVDQSKEYIVGYTDKVAPINGYKDYIIFGDHTREWKYVNFDFCTGADGTQVLQAKEDYDSKFVYYVCLSLKIPNTGYNRHFKYVKEAKYLIPTFPEQQKIASFFTSLDRQIDLESLRLEKLKQVKKACLDKMFV